MLSSLRTYTSYTETVPKINVNDKWVRNQKEDMKKAMDYLYEFREKLDELHPECVIIIESMLQQRRY